MTIAHKTLLGLSLAALGLAAAPAAQAQAGSIYNFEFQGQSNLGSNTPYAGSGALAGAGTTWNVLTLGSPSVTNAVASNGAASTVAFTAGLTTTFSLFNDGVAANPDEMLTNYAVDKGGPDTIHFSGLAANAPFLLDLYGTNGNSDNTKRGTIFTLTQSDYTTPLQTARTVNVQDTSFVLGDNYVQFWGKTDGGGNIYATYQNNPINGNTEGDFNGAQLQMLSTPEPSSVAAFAVAFLGLGGLFLRARRRA